jgi:ATP-dependent protease HslVU (ClpYQ) ATPase subunit
MIGLVSLLKEIQGKPKAIFMAGPAGSGKSYISSKLVPSNFITINVDDTFEELLKSSGIGMKLAQMSPDELKKAGELMGQARKTTDVKYKDTLKDAKNILIDSVGGSSKTLLIEPLGQVGKEKSPEELAKSEKEKQQIYSDIKSALQSQPKFDTEEQAKTKITNFINK